MTKSHNVFSLNCTDGVFDFYVVEYYDYTLYDPLIKSVLVRSPEGMSAAVRCHQLMKEGKLAQWDRIRPALETEVEWWIGKHPEKVSNPPV